MTHLVTLEPRELTGYRDARHAGRRCADRDCRTQLDARRVEPLGRPRRHEPGEVVARHDRVELGGTGRDDDLGGVDVEHPVGVRATSSGPG